MSQTAARTLRPRVGMPLPAPRVPSRTRPTRLRVQLPALRGPLLPYLKRPLLTHHPEQTAPVLPLPAPLPLRGDRAVPAFRSWELISQLPTPESGGAGTPVAPGCCRHPGEPPPTSWRWTRSLKCASHCSWQPSWSCGVYQPPSGAHRQQHQHGVHPRRGRRPCCLASGLLSPYCQLAGRAAQSPGASGPSGHITNIYSVLAAISAP